MAQVAGALEIQIFAGIARLQKDMNDAKTVVGGAMKNIEGAVASAKSALGALGIGLSVGYFASLINGSIDAMDHLNDLGKATSITVENLAGLRLAAKQSGGDLDSIATSINKLSQNMGKETEKFAALGVSAKDPLEAFKQLSDIFVAIQDPQQRAAVMAAALGKAWAGAAPLLAEGGKKIGEMVARGTQLSGMTQDLAKQADDLNDKIAELTKTGGLLTRMVGPLLPLMNSLADDMLKVGDKARGANTEFSLLAEVMKTLVILGANISFTFTTLGKDMARAAENAKLIATGDWAGSRSLGEFFRKDSEAARAALDAYEKKILALGTAAGKAGKDVANSQLFEFAGGGIKPDGSATAARAAAFLKEKKEVTDTDSAYRNMVKTLKEMLLLDHERTEVNKIQIALDQMDAKQRAQFWPEREKYVKALGAEADARKARAAQMENDAKNEDALTKARREGAEAMAAAEAVRGAAILAADKSIEQMKFETSIINLTNVEREQAIFLRQAEIDKIDAATVSRGREAIAAKHAAEEAKSSQVSMWQSVESAGHQAFLSIFDTSKSVLERIRDMLKTHLIDILYQATIKPWIVQIAASTAGAGVAQAAFGSAAGAGMSGLSLASGANTVSGWFGGPSIGPGTIGSWFGSGAATSASAGAALGELGINTAAMTEASLAAAAEAGIGTGVATGLSAAMPYIGAALLAYSLLSGGGNNNAQAAGPPDQFRTMFSATRSGLTTPAGYSFQGKRIDGGQYSDNTLLDAQQAVMVNNAVVKLFADYTAAAEKAGLSTAALAGEISTAHSSTLTAGSAQETYNRALASLSDNIAAALIPNLAELQLVGESLSQTFARLTGATEAQAAAVAKAEEDSRAAIAKVEEDRRAAELAAAEAAQAELARIAAERYGIETQLLQFQGDTARLRERELAQIDASNRALQGQIYALQDQAAAAQAQEVATLAATAAIEKANAAALQTEREREAAVTTAVGALRQAYQREAADLTAMIGKWDAAGTSLRAYSATLAGAGGTGASYAAASGAFGAAAASARLGDLTAIGSLQSVSETFRTASLAASATQTDYLRDIGRIQAAIADTVGVTDRQGSVAQQQLDGMRTQVSSLIDINDSVRSVQDAIKDLKTELANLRASSDKTAASTAAQESFWRRLSPDGQSLQTVAA